MATRVQRLGALAIAVAAAVIAGAAIASAEAETRVVPPGDGLQAAISAAAAGDRLLLRPGVHQGAVEIDRPLAIEGEAGAIVDGGGVGTVMRIASSGVTVRGLQVRHSGGDLDAGDAGIKVDRGSADVLVEGNRLEDNMFGIYVAGAKRITLRGNDVLGRQSDRPNDRADGIKIWNSPDVLVEGNTIRFGRDGIFVVTSRKDRLVDNSMSDLRFAVHYMYADDGVLIGNHSARNHVGYALMNSTRLLVERNVSDHDRDHGIALNYSNEGEIAGNVVRGGAEKCVFIYNANKNHLSGNRLDGCQIGIHFTAGAERNVFTRNAFISNATQVKYVGTTWLEWSEGGVGNYWSDNTGIDLDNDGIADTAYQPNDLVDQVVWRHPLAKLLLTSPAVQTIRWAQNQFPALHPGGVVDSVPLMRPPPEAPEAGG